jgi:hypothetical protein
MPTLFLVLLATVRIVHFGSSTATVTTQNGAQQVVIKDAQGRVEADSYCDSQSGYYDQIVKFGRSLVAAAKSNDPRAIMALVQYPLRVNISSSNHFFIKDAPTLKARYQTVFTEKVLGQIRDVEPHGAFCRMGMSMFGGGVIWATADKSGVLKAAVVNQ